MNKTVNIGVQMYTLRDAAEKDMVGTLTAVAKQGYAGVELADFNGLSAQELRDVLQANRLQVVSAHVSLDELMERPRYWCEAMRTLDSQRITMPYIEPDRLDEIGIARFSDMLNTIQKSTAEEGIELSYHNHHFEFVKGVYEPLIERCPHMKFELDTYWAAFADVDPIQLMKQLGDRLALVHIKDMSASVKEERVIGALNPHILEGVLDIPAILNQAALQGIEWAVVEMDYPTGDPLEAVRISRENLYKCNY